MKHLAGQRVLVLGLGISGLALARWCARFGSSVTVADTRAEPPQLPALRHAVPQATFIAGDLSQLLAGEASYDLILKSPGLSPAELAPVLTPAAERGMAVGNEVTLFMQALRELGELPAEGENVSEEAAEVAEAAQTADMDQAEVAEVGPPAEDGEAVEVFEAEEVGQAEAPAEAQAALAPAESSEPADSDDELPMAVPPPLPVPRYQPKVLAITGTNGKTTVTSLTGQLVQRAGKQVAVCGNIGPSLLDTLADCLDAQEQNDAKLPEVWVLELSSFQLEGIKDFEPSAAVVLNLSQDHLDWHGSMAAYAQAKANIFGQQALMLLNRDDPAVMAMLPEPVKAPGKNPFKPKQQRAHQSFGIGVPERPGDWGLETVNGMTWLVRAAEADETFKPRKGEEVPLYVQRLMPVDALHIRGLHNASNALAALALAASAGCNVAPLLHGLRDYRGEPHRVESIAVVNEVEFFDDSKGTNVGATVAALKGLGASRQLVLILGGEGKGQDFSPLAEPVSRHVRAVVLIGRDAPLIRAALQDCGVPLLDASTLPQAVELAAARAHSGDAVLMSPACASFDMFDNYGHRGQVFGEAVRALALDAGVMA